MEFFCLFCLPPVSPAWRQAPWWLTTGRVLHLDHCGHRPTSGGRIAPCAGPHSSQSQSCVATDGQSASLFWFQALIWGPKTRFACLLMWDVSVKRTGLPLTILVGARQRSHSRVRHDQMLLILPNPRECSCYHCLAALPGLTSQRPV
jgi:hypothetical protein